ncbi:MAG: reverse transcriptase/maturase family protein [Candidatus Pacearchaeota archaeon]
MDKNRIIKELFIAAKQTKKTHQKKQYYLNISSIVLNLSEQLLKKNYLPGKYTCFAVSDPAPREILAPSYPDRIVHRWLVNKMEPFVDKRLLSCSYANRKGKGHHQAVKDLHQCLHNYENKFYLKADIKSFFNSIHHATLLLLVNRWISKMPLSEKEKEIISFVCEKIITHNPTLNVVFTGNKELLEKVPLHKSYFNNKAGIGLPLGNLTSQFFANIYLHELDWYVKQHLKVRYYFRYVDDFVILGKSVSELQEVLKSIEKFLEEKLHLELHPQKIRIQPVKNGIDFCGYVVWPRSILVRKRVLKQYNKKVNFFRYLFNPEKYSDWKMNVTGNSYLEKAFRERKLNLPVTFDDISIIRRMRCSISSYRGIIEWIER